MKNLKAILQEEGLVQKTSAMKLKGLRGTFLVKKIQATPMRLRKQGLSLSWKFRGDLNAGLDGFWRDLIIEVKPDPTGVYLIPAAGSGGGADVTTLRDVIFPVIKEILFYEGKTLLEEMPG